MAKIGERGDPWGIPLRMGRISEVKLSKERAVVRSLRKDLMSEIVSGLKPKWVSLAMRPS